MPASTDGSMSNLTDSLPLSSTPIDSCDQLDALSIPDASPVKHFRHAKQLHGEIPFTRIESDVSDLENEYGKCPCLYSVQLLLYTDYYSMSGLLGSGERI